MTGEQLLQDLALSPAQVIGQPGDVYADAARHWQGIPGIERATNGRLWALWYSGGTGEEPGNYVVLVTSADDGATWSGPKFVIHHPHPGVRCFDPVLWHDPQQRLWCFWAQSEDKFDGRAGVWAIRCDDATWENPRWSSPRRLANGIMMNKPTVLSSGEWLLPTAVWGFLPPHRPELATERFSNVVTSDDQGETWHLRGQADVPQRCFDEHMLVERTDGSLWMLVRRFDGIGEAVSTDRGVTWAATPHAVLAGPNARFFIRRLQSGRLLLVNHVDFTGRNNLTAMVSADDGHSWVGGLMLDARADVSYPDGVEADGRIYLIYDRERYAAREILMAVFTEEDVLAGRLVSAEGRLRVLVNRGGNGTV